jgi:hypothetical protein
MWHGHFVEHLVCNQRKKKKASTHTSHTIQQIFVAKGKGLGIKFIPRGGSLIPVHGMNRDQCSAESHVPRWGGIGPGSCHKPGPIPRHEPGPAPKRHEPGSMPVIVPICLLNRDRWLLCPGPKTLFPLVIATSNLSLLIDGSMLQSFGFLSCMM